MMLTRDFLMRNAEAWPEREAYVSESKRLTWAEVAERSLRLARALQDLGVNKGDVVVSMSWDSHETIEIFYACTIIGAVRTGINPRYGATEVSHIVQDSEASVMLVAAGASEDVVTGLQDSLNLRHIVGIGNHSQQLDYETVLAASDPAPEWVELSGSDTIAISYTSGSTGVPKGVLWRHEAVVEACSRTWMQTGGRCDDVFLHSLPAAGVPILMIAFNVFYGSKVVIQSRFDPEESLRIIEREKVTTVLWIPTMLIDVLEHPQFASYDTTSLRLVVYGTMPASSALIRKAIDLLGCEMVQWYGSTEGTGGWFTQLTNDDHLAALDGNPELLMSCGRPFLHFRMKIVDAEDNVAPAGEVGEICVSSTTLMSGYLNKPEDTDRMLRDSWLRTGDMGRVDEKGYLFLVDRKDFMIITGGYNVYPVAVENEIANHPDVREACVFGVPDRRLGEVVCAVIVARSPLTTGSLDALRSELIEHVERNLGKLHRPHVVDFVEELPRGATGKLLKRAVRDEYREKVSPDSD